MKKDEIIKSSRELFTKHGFKRVSMDDIARESGVTKKTIYTYFTSKEELLEFFIKEQLNNMKNIVEEIDKKNYDFYENIHQIIYQLLKYRSQEDFLKLIAKEAKDYKSPIVIRKVSTIDSKIQEYILGKIKKAKENENINVNDEEIAAFLIYKMYISLIFEWDDSKQKLNEEIISKNIINFLKNGLGKKDVENEKR